MCNYKVMARSKDGYVIWCNECSHYNLAFGTTGVCFTADKFVEFCEYIIALKHTVVCNGFQCEKRIKVNVFNDSTMMILNYRELKWLYAIICEAKFNLETDQLLSELNLITE